MGCKAFGYTASIRFLQYKAPPCLRQFEAIRNHSHLESDESRGGTVHHDGHGSFQQFKTLFRSFLTEIEGRKYPDDVALGEIDEQPELKALDKNLGRDRRLADFYGQKQPFPPGEVPG